MTIRVCIVGGGGIGTWLIAALLRAQKVAVVFIARGEHGKLVKQQGLTVRMHEDSGENISHLSTDGIEIYSSAAEALRNGSKPVDYAIVCVKVPQMEAVVADFGDYLAEDGCFVTTQNGLEAPDIVATVAGHRKVMGGSSYVNSWIDEPGTLDMLGGTIPNKFAFGEAYDEATGEKINKRNARYSQRAEKLAAAFDGGGTEIEVAQEGIWGTIWAKAGFTCCMGPVSALVRAPLSVLAVPETRALLRSTTMEWALCRVAAGYHPEGGVSPEEVVEQIIDRLSKLPAGMTTSTTRDVMMGRPSELYDLTGSIQRAGTKLGVPTPTNDMLFAALLPQELRARGQLTFKLNGVVENTSVNASSSSTQELQKSLDALLVGDCLQSGGGRVTLTMHDLPAWPHWRCAAGQSAVDITNKVLAALEKHGITGVYNFSNSGTGMLPNDESTTIPYDASYRCCLDAWVAAKQHIANHTHSHAAVYQVTTADLKDDIKRADEVLAPYISRAPSKFFCFCVDCQGDTPEVAKELAEFVSGLGYRQLSAASMVFEWRWESAYLGALAAGDVDTAAKLRSEFINYSVRQTVLDCKRGRLLCGADFIPSLLLHMLNIVADTMDEWLTALKGAECEFVAAEECIKCDFWQRLEGIADPIHAARPALAKVAEDEGLKWTESSKQDTEIMNWVQELAATAMKSGHIQLTNHLGSRNIEKKSEIK